MIHIIIGEQHIVIGEKLILSGVKQSGFGLLFFVIKAEKMSTGAIRGIIIAVYDVAGVLPAVFQVIPALIVQFLTCTGAMERNEWQRLNLRLLKFYLFIKKDNRIVTG